GTARGAGIALTSGDGELISLGEATEPQQLQDGSNTLLFSAYLQGIDSTIVPGDFSAVTDFTLAYN
ncbi:MAG: fimbrial protein, partial [Plesiomonas sp.]